MEKVDFDRYKDACCYMTPDELKKYVDNTISIWGDINKQNIKQIEAVFENDVYVLLNDGKLYENGKQIIDGIAELWCMNIHYLFVINKENYVYSIQDNIFNNYIGNTKYKKIVKSGLDLLALTYDKNVKSLTSYLEFIGIEPENFIDVDDISITGELGTPYVIKNGKKIPLYISEYNEEE